jgi:import inner membrane translocase subunit TIM23
MKFNIFSVLNGCTRRGPFVANSLGVLALMYSTLDYGIGKLREKDDQYNSIAAAVSTGVIFKSTGNGKFTCKVNVHKMTELQ